MSCGMYNTNSEIDFKTSTLISSLYDYSDVYIFEKRKMTITGEKDDVATRQRHKRDKKNTF